MKKTYLFISICFLFFSSKSNAQISALIEGGVNLTTIDLSSQTDLQSIGEIENRTGFYIAFIPKIYLTEKIMFNVEGQYSQEGYKRTGDDFEAKFQYVRLLPQLEIKLINSLGIYGGYNFGFNISEQIKEFNSSFTTIDPGTIKKTDNGFTVGARVYVGKFSLTAKYNFGIQNINDLIYTDQNGQPVEVEHRNRNFQIGVGYSIF